MSFVGTRPEATKYVEKYSNEMLATLLLPAGITSEGERVRIVRRFRLAGARRKSVYEISYIINYFDAFM